ncbi:MAG: hypothetical protein H7326_00230 [Bdellovibrionaceae bacterium]|nr:hypothetical protein [Pseudobdellovibrionaceae bacterium]
MSMLEVLFTCVLLGFSILGFIEGVHIYSKGISSSNQNEAIANSLTRIVSAFGDDDRLCTSILRGTRLSVSDANGSQVPQIDYMSMDGQKVGDLIKLDQPLENRSDITLSDIRLKPFSALNATDVFANLEFKFKKMNSFYGSQFIVRSIPIYATLSAGKVLTCSTSPLTKVMISNRKCIIQSDGFAHFDPLQNQCVDNPEVLWFFGGTPYQASCGAGYRPAVSPLNPAPAVAACFADTGVGGVLIPSRTYSDGFVANDNLFAWTAKPNRLPMTSCVFAYDASYVVTQAKARIKCVAN